MVKIVPGNDRLTVFDGNKFIGYVENDILYGFDQSGFAVEIDRIDHQNEIGEKLTRWRRKQFL